MGRDIDDLGGLQPDPLQTLTGGIPAVEVRRLGTLSFARAGAKRPYVFWRIRRRIAARYDIEPSTMG
jgi:hypothetical protein